MIVVSFKIVDIKKPNLMCYVLGELLDTSPNALLCNLHSRYKSNNIYVSSFHIIFKCDKWTKFDVVSLVDKSGKRSNFN